MKLNGEWEDDKKGHLIVQERMKKYQMKKSRDTWMKSGSIKNQRKKDDMLLRKMVADESGSEDDERNRDVANIARVEELIKNKLAETEEKSYSLTDSDNMSDLDHVEEE